MRNHRRRFGPFEWHRADCLDNCPVWILSFRASFYVGGVYFVFAFGRHKEP